MPEDADQRDQGRILMVEARDYANGLVALTLTLQEQQRADGLLHRPVRLGLQDIAVDP